MKFPSAATTALWWAQYVHERLRQHRRDRLDALYVGWTEPDTAPTFALDPTPAVQRFALSKPVEINIVRCDCHELAGSFGSIELDPYAATYKTYIARHLEPYFASAVLWHELTHAFQMEREGLGFLFDYWAEYDDVMREGYTWEAYARISFEKEAYESMNNHFALPLDLSGMVR